MNTRLILVIAALGVLLSGCASSGQAPIETMDPLTAVTVTRSARPLVFYRDQSARAAHARDFINLGPFQVNRMGDYHYFLWVGIWSTLPDELRDDDRDGFETLTLFVDGEPWSLPIAGWTPDSFGGSDSVFLKPVASATDAYYEVTLDQIRLLSSASDVRLQSGGAFPGAYELWDDEQPAFAAMREFVDRVSYY